MAIFPSSRRQFLKLLGTLPAVLAAGGASAAAGPFIRGVNISGGEFGSKGGKRGHKYFYPDVRDIENAQAFGFQAIRVPFKWERLQYEPFGELLNSNGDDDDVKALGQSVEQITRRGLICILDMHNYGRRLVNGQATVIGEGTLPVEAYIDGWSRLSAAFGSNDLVWLGLMNEPHGIRARTWAEIMQQTVRGLRAKGIGNKLLVPGTAWTGAHSWISSGNAAAYEQFEDPGENFAYEVHQYLDSDFSGTKNTCISDSGFYPLEKFELWCREKPGRIGFLGEFGVPRNDAGCAALLSQMLARMQENRDTWLGWAAWGGGRWWGNNYPMRIDRAKGETQDNRFSQVLAEDMAR